MHSGTQSPAYFGTIPRTRPFLGVLISSARGEEKNNPQSEGKKKTAHQEEKNTAQETERKGRIIFSSIAESARTDRYFSALSSQDLVTIVTVFLYVQPLLTQCGILCNIH